MPLQHFDISSPIYPKANPSLRIDHESLVKQTQAHKVLVAVIDSGVDYNHPQLKSHIRLNQKGDGVGLDITGRDPLPFPILFNPKSGNEIDDLMGQNVHGTHVASLALLGGRVKDAQGEVQDAGTLLGLVPVRAIPLDDEGAPEFEGDAQSDEERAFRANEVDKHAVVKLVKYLGDAASFAHTEGARVANLSLGIEADKLTPEANRLLKKEIRTKLYSKMINEWRNILFVFAAGNDAIEVIEGNYPASLKSDNMLTVGALNKFNEIAGYSNHGGLVDIYIQGSDINGLVPGGQRDRLSGTSMATPIISNLAAKILLTAPCLEASEVRSIIMNTADIKVIGVGETMQKREVRVASFKKALEKARSLGKKCF